MVGVWDKLLTEPKKGTKVPNMSSIAPRTSQFGAALFTETQQRVLGYLFGQPARSFYAKELIKKTGSGSGAVQRELKRLEASGLLTSRWQGNQKHFQANQKAPIFEELCSIALKTFALADPIRESLQGLETDIKAAFIYGSVARKAEHAVSDIDLLVISDKLGYGELMVAMENAEKMLGRKINPTLYSDNEFKHRQMRGNSFITRVLEQPCIWLIGEKDDLTT